MVAAGRTVHHPLTAGTPVEVWNRFESAFTPGFAISGRVGDGYQIRRMSDGVDLPVMFRGPHILNVLRHRWVLGHRWVLARSGGRSPIVGHRSRRTDGRR